MIKLIRKLLGLCNHEWVLDHIIETKFRGDEGKFIHIDMAKAGRIKHRDYILTCSRCGKLKIKRKSHK